MSELKVCNSAYRRGSAKSPPTPLRMGPSHSAGVGHSLAGATSLEAGVQTGLRVGITWKLSRLWLPCPPSALTVSAVGVVQAGGFLKLPVILPSSRV